MGILVQVKRFTREEYGRAIAQCIAHGVARARQMQVRAARRHLTLAQAFRVQATAVFGGRFPPVPWDDQLLGLPPTGPLRLPYAVEFRTLRQRAARDLSGVDDAKATAARARRTASAALGVPVSARRE
jgi:hypothetical protein